MVESAGSFRDGRCCHPTGYLQIALGLPPSPSLKSLRRFHQSNHGNGISHFSRTVEDLHPEIEGDKNHEQSGDLTDPDRWKQEGSGAGADQSPGEHCEGQ
jgi:hypothetical protein